MVLSPCLYCSKNVRKVAREATFTDTGPLGLSGAWEVKN